MRDYGPCYHGVVLFRILQILPGWGDAQQDDRFHHRGCRGLRNADKSANLGIIFSGGRDGASCLVRFPPVPYFAGRDSLFPQNRKQVQHHRGTRKLACCREGCGLNRYRSTSHEPCLDPGPSALVPIGLKTGAKDPLA